MELNWSEFRKEQPEQLRNRRARLLGQDKRQEVSGSISGFRRAGEGGGPARMSASKGVLTGPTPGSEGVDEQEQGKGCEPPGSVAKRLGAQTQVLGAKAC